MSTCKIIDVLYAAVPSRLVRGWLIRRHVETCSRCQARLVSRSETAALFVKPEEAGAPGELWRTVEPRVGREVNAAARRAPWPRWEWAAGAASLLALAVAGFWLLQGLGPAPIRTDFARPADRFEIDYVNVGGAPAQTFIYQPQGSDMIIVWAGKTP